MADSVTSDIKQSELELKKRAKGQISKTGLLILEQRAAPLVGRVRQMSAGPGKRRRRSRRRGERRKKKRKRKM